MTEQNWVINASPLILLGKINQLELVERLASRLIVPQSVTDEIAAGTQDRSIQSTLNWAQRHIHPDIAVPVSILKWDIGAGESQVLAQCMRHNGSKAVLDDRTVGVKKNAFIRCHCGQASGREAALLEF